MLSNITYLKVNETQLFKKEFLVHLPSGPCIGKISKVIERLALVKDQSPNVGLLYPGPNQTLRILKFKVDFPVPIREERSPQTEQEIINDFLYILDIFKHDPAMIKLYIHSSSPRCGDGGFATKNDKGELNDEHNIFELFEWLRINMMDYGYSIAKYGITVYSEVWDRSELLTTPIIIP